MTTAYALDLADGKLTTVEIDNPTALFRDTWTDALYVSSLDAVSALFTGATRESATWSRTIVFPKYETFSWLVVESDFLDADATAESAVVNVYNESGTLLSTSTVSSRTPVRLTPFYEREIRVEVVSRARITGVILASTTDELQAVQ